MRNSFCRLSIAFLVLLTAQATFGQKAKIASPAEVNSSRNFCFKIIKPSESDCPVGENIPYSTPFLEAIRQRDLELVKRMIAEGADVNEIENRGFTALTLAAKGDFEVIDILLKAGADVNFSAQYGATPLISAAFCSQAVKTFLDAGAAVDQRNINNQTALMIAAQYGNIDSVKLLLAAKADLSARDVDEMTPLLFAIKGGHLDVVRFLYEKGAKKDLADETIAALALQIASGNAQPEMVKFLLEAGVNPNLRQKYKTTAMTTAAMRGNIEIIKLLLDAGADPNIRGEQTPAPLTWASNYGHTEIVKLLLAAKADINVREDWSPLISAARNEHIETMEVLLKAGADINQRAYDGKTALIYSVWEKRVKSVKFLIEKGADVNVRDEDDNVTALSMATKNAAGYSDPKLDEITQLLRNAGAVE